MTLGRVEGRPTESVGVALHALARGERPDFADAASVELRDLVVRHGLHLAMAQAAAGEQPEIWASTFHSAIARQTVMRRHLRRLLERFVDAGIPATPLKGPHVADMFYSDPSVRPFTDIDLLVPAEHLSGALSLIEVDPHVASVPPKRPEADKRDIPLSDPSGLGFSLDLHWDLFSYTQLRGAADGATAEAWSRATFVDDDLGPRYEFPIEVTLAFLCLHALLDHRFRLILFRDLAEVARHIDNWEPFIEYVTRWSLRSYSYVSLALARQYAGAEIPDRVMARLQPGYPLMSATKLMLDRVDIAHFDGHRTHPLNLALVLLHDRWRDRAALTFRAPFSYPEWKRRIDVVERPGIRGPRLLLIVATDKRRGAEVVGEHLASGLTDRGWQVDLVSLSHSTDGPWINCTPIVDDSGQGRRFHIGTARALIKEIRKSKPDVVLANGGSTLRYASICALWSRTALCYRSIGEPAYWHRTGLQRLLGSLLHRSCELIFAVSDRTRNELIELFGLDPGVVITGYRGVPPSFFALNSSATASEALRMLFLGALSDEKDPFAALAVLERLAPRTALLRFVGSGPLEPQLAETVRNQGLEASVEMVGSVADVAPHLEWADVLILPSETEGLPGAVLEAAAAGVPTAAFDVGGVSEVVVDGRSGFVVPQGDIDALSQAVAKLGSDHELRRSLGREARASALERFTMDVSTDLYDRALRQLLLRRVKA